MPNSATHAPSRQPHALTVFTHYLLDGWKSLTIWSVAVAAVSSLYLGLWPSMRSSFSATSDMIKAMPKSLTKAVGYDQLTSGAGYTQVTILGIMGFMLLSIAAIGWSNRAIATPLERGDMELSLAHALGRTGLYVQRSVAVLLQIAVFCTVVGLCILAWNGPGELQIKAANLLPSLIGMGLLGVLAASFSLAAGAVFASRNAALGAGALLTVGAYLANALGKQGEKYDFLLSISPYNWAFDGKTLENGWSGASDYWLLCLVAAVVWLAGLVAFQRRDIS